MEANDARLYDSNYFSLRANLLLARGDDEKAKMWASLFNEDSFNECHVSKTLRLEKSEQNVTLGIKPQFSDLKALKIKIKAFQLVAKVSCKTKAFKVLSSCNFNF